MKRALIGCCLTLTGAIGYLAVFIVSANDMASGWSTPPGRFMTTIEKTGMTFPLVVSTALFLIGLIIMTFEYFRKEK